MHSHDQGASGLPVHLQTLSADVCQYWYYDRQRAEKQSKPLGPLARQTLPASIPGQTDARIGSAAETDHQCESVEQVRTTPGGGSQLVPFESGRTTLSRATLPLWRSPILTNSPSIQSPARDAVIFPVKTS